jgi:hypothetical protein
MTSAPLPFVACNACFAQFRFGVVDARRHVPNQDLVCFRLRLFNPFQAQLFRATKFVNSDRFHIAFLVPSLMKLHPAAQRMQQRRKSAAFAESAGMTCRALLNRRRTLLRVPHGQEFV